MMNSKKLSIALSVVSFLGFLDASYLTIEHYLNAIPPCSIGGCETVLTSSYASVAGVPLAILGVLYYLAVFFMVQTGKTRWLKVLATAGFVASLGLLGVQAFVLHAYCLYCLGSLVTSTLIFILAWLPRGDSI